jgi:hypothetical protein
VNSTKYNFGLNNDTIHYERFTFFSLSCVLNLDLQLRRMVYICECYFFFENFEDYLGVELEA